MSQSHGPFTKDSRVAISNMLTVNVDFVDRHNMDVITMNTLNGLLTATAISGTRTALHSNYAFSAMSRLKGGGPAVGTKSGPAAAR